MAFRCVELDKEEILFGGYSAVAISVSCGNEGGHCNSIYKASKLEEGSLESGSIGTTHLERGRAENTPQAGHASCSQHWYCSFSAVFCNPPVSPRCLGSSWYMA